jgi:RNA-directed DNA polymerase
MSREAQVRFCEGLGVRFPRATRLVILCGSLRAGQRILQSVRRFLAEELKLTVNEAKSHKKFKTKVKVITKRTRGHSPKKVIAELERYVRGAFNYYGLGITFGEARELDMWLRTRVRLYYWTALPRSGVPMAQVTAESRA